MINLPFSWRWSRRCKTQPLTVDLLREAKRIEFPDNVIATSDRKDQKMRSRRCATTTVSWLPIRWLIPVQQNLRQRHRIITPCFGSENEAVETSGKKKVLVLGSGPIRIGQGIEFDFCSVHSTWAFAKEGYETIIVNNNPETVSTDFDIADKLYFEPLTPEDVENIVDIEKPDGAVVQFGGQTAIKLTEVPDEDGCADSRYCSRRCRPQQRTESCLMKILEKCQHPKTVGPYRIYGRGGKESSSMSWAIRFWYARPTYLADRVCRSRSTMKM